MLIAPRKNKGKKNYASIIGIVTFFAVLIFSLDLGGFLDPIKGYGDLILNPIRYWFYERGRNITTLVKDISSITALQSENRELMIEISDLRQENAEYEELKRENEVLRSQLGLESIVSSNLIISNVIQGDLRSLNSELIILNRGRLDGVDEGAPVIWKGNLIGQVFEVEERISKIRLITSNEISVSVISEDNRTKGIVNGDINGGVLMSKILREENVEEGELILTSGIGVFPKGLIVGRVVEIRGQDSDAEKVARIELLFDFKIIEELFIIDAQ